MWPADFREWNRMMNEDSLLNPEEETLDITLKNRDGGEDRVSVSDFWFNAISGVKLSTLDFFRISLYIILTGYLFMFYIFFMFNVGLPFVSGVTPAFIYQV